MNEERRGYHRVSFNADAKLFAGDTEIHCQLLDISIHGVMLECNSVQNFSQDANYHIEIPLDESDHLITMQLALKNERDNIIGMECTHIDLDSISLLRRLVELNLGQPEFLDRDFAALIKDNQN